MTTQERRKTLRNIAKFCNGSDKRPYEDWHMFLLQTESEHDDWRKLRRAIVNAIKNENNPTRVRAELADLRWKVLHEMALFDVDAYFLYLEKDRRRDVRFYLPRRQGLLPLVNGFQAMLDDEVDILTVSMPPRSGKLVADPVPVLTRNGWKCHGNLVVGDEVVGLDGDWKKVTYVFPKQVANREVVFTNGEVVQVHANHEWYVHNRWRQKTDVVETDFIKHKGIHNGGGRFMFQLPRCDVMKGTPSAVPVHPYVLGVWLGGGACTSPKITICDEDKHVVDEVLRLGGYELGHVTEQVGSSGYYIIGLIEGLQKLGMCHTRESVDKRIPDVYLTLPVEDRLELLAGLIDTDGTRSGDKRYMFSTASEQIKDGFISLVSTFGWRTSVVEEQLKLSSSGIQGKQTVYTIGFCPHEYEIPVRVERKKLTREAIFRKISVKDIYPINPVSGNCIEVEGGIYRIGKTMLPTHNSTASIFFLTMLIGLYPESTNLVSGHSTLLTNSFFDGVLEILTSPEYNWKQIFPLNTIAEKNKKETTLKLNRVGRMKTLTCRSIEGSLTGACDANKLLYADDLVSGIEEAMSKPRLDKLWVTYTDNLMSRMVGSCKELHVATRWSVHDVIGRIQREHADNPRARFIVVPALNEQGESNFDYDNGLGFSTEYYTERKRMMDEASFKALYMNQPIEREGLLYPEGDLRRYDELPVDPDGNPLRPDAIISIADTKIKGKDYFFSPVAYVYGDDYYIEDCICDNGIAGLEARTAMMYLQHDVEMSEFESNSAGGAVADKCQSICRELGAPTDIRKQWSGTNKETRIITNSGWVKEHCLFRSSYPAVGDYTNMMRLLTSYSQSGKNEYDDPPDGMAMLASFARSLKGYKAEAIDNPFW